MPAGRSPWPDISAASPGISISAGAGTAASFSTTSTMKARTAAHKGIKTLLEAVKAYGGAVKTFTHQPDVVGFLEMDFNQRVTGVTEALAAIRGDTAPQPVVHLKRVAAELVTTHITLRQARRRSGRLRPPRPTRCSRW